jgi:hypothetical protein
MPNFIEMLSKLGHSIAQFSPLWHRVPTYSVPPTTTLASNKVGFAVDNVSIVPIVFYLWERQSPIRSSHAQALQLQLILTLRSLTMIAVVSIMFTVDRNFCSWVVQAICNHNAPLRVRVSQRLYRAVSGSRLI